MDYPAKDDSERITPKVYMGGDARPMNNFPLFNAENRKLKTIL